MVVDIFPHSATHGHRASTPTVAAQGWPADGSVEDRINALRSWVTALERRLEDQRKEALRTDADLRREIGRVEGALGRETTGLWGVIEAGRQEAARIDARGFLVVGAGILLTAAPNQLAAIPAVGLTAMVLSVPVAVAFGVATFRERHRQRRNTTGWSDG